MDKSDLRASIADELTAVGIHVKPIHGPRTAIPVVGVLIPASFATEMELAATAASLLTVVGQDFSVFFTGANRSKTGLLREWLAGDTRFQWVATKEGLDWRTKYILVLPPGTRMGRWSLEAIIDAHQATGVPLLRILIDGRMDAIEIWDTQQLLQFTKHGDPEVAARKMGGERWLSGSSLGIHDYLQPEPKMHLRKGSASRHDMTIMIHDASDDVVRKDYGSRIRQLEYQLVKAKFQVRQMETGLRPDRGLMRAASIVKRSPLYVKARTRMLHRWVGK